MRRQVALLAFMVVLGGFAYLSLTRVQFSANLYDLLPKDLSEVQGMDWLNRYFSRDGQLTVTISSPYAATTSETTESLIERLRAEPELVGVIHQEMPLDKLAQEGGGLLSWLWLNADPRDVVSLAERLEAPASGETIDEAMLMIQDGLFDDSVMVRSYDPLALTRLPDSLRSMDSSRVDAMSSEDGTFQIFYLEGNGVDFSDYRASGVWLDRLKELVARWRDEAKIPDEVSIGFTGTPAFMGEVGREMEKDMTLSVFLTMAMISVLFWVMHRQSQPLGWLIASLFLILILTLNLGGLLFGRLSVMSAGFAAILMGLAVDYGIVLYREAINGTGSARELRGRVGSAIGWAALTTVIVFLSLNLSSLPGIAEMGNLVALGIAIGAAVMLWGFSLVAVRFARHGKDRPVVGSESAPSRGSGVVVFLVTGIAVAIPLVTLGSICVKKMPGLEAEFHPFRIRSSPSMISWMEMQEALRGEEITVPLVVTGATIGELLDNLRAADHRLKQAEEDGQVSRYLLPFGLLPDPVNQRFNLRPLEEMVKSRDRLLGELDAAGFSEEGQALTREVLGGWEQATRQIRDAMPANPLEAATSTKQLETGAFFAFPEDRFARWSVGRVFRKGEQFAALGTVTPVDPDDRSWVEQVCNVNTAAASLGSLGTALNDRINADMKTVVFPMMLLLTLMLAVVFRNWKDWLLAIFTLFFAGCTMVLITLWTPLSWNSFNVCGLPLLFGTGLDFGIHMIFALRRSGGDLRQVRHGISKALVFCGSSSAIGFGSLSLASAYGLASLGIVCAVGILINMVVAVWLLPRWYRLIHRVERPDFRTGDRV